ncbi:hypothetical protein KBTX_04293 [wastewater metagenome]|uniref:Uncharacterized protein n=2 Tax=unclassified sequences TaxID=12908 RepID=A0A5B8RLN6_9ZZZZ|nr:hypothetical protein KBTEX_04293 [uncultured organism]
MMMAVDDNASAPPITVAAPPPAPSAQAVSPSTPVHSATWAPPRPNTVQRIARSCGRENSRPMVNSRKTTPNSASGRTSSTSPTSPVADGPSATPTAR